MTEVAVAARGLLDAHPHCRATPRLAMLDFDVEMRTPDDKLTRYLTELYAPMQSTQPGPADHVLTLSSSGPAGATTWSVHLDATRVIASPAPSVAFSYLLWEANRRAIDATSDLVAVHASAAVSGDVAIVLPGPMGAGKSTLVASLVRAGLGYLTDEVVGFDASTGLIRPYPKYISVGEALDDLVPPVPESIRAFIGDQRLVPPDAIRRGAAAGATRPRVIVTPRYERGATAALERLSPAAALGMLAQHAFHIERDGQRTLDVLADVVEQSSCFALVSGDVPTATSVLLDQLDRVQEPVS